MAPTRQRDRHGTPILISSSPSSPRPLKSKVQAAASPRGVVKLPPKPFPALQQVENGKQTQQRADTSRNDINDVRGEQLRPVSARRPRRRSAGQVDEYGK
jgi:hypothetical protein